MAEQGSPDAGTGDASVVDPLNPIDLRRDLLLRDRKSRAGRLSYITFAVNSQLALTRLSAQVKVQMMDAEENYGDYLSPEQKDRLLTARERMLDAADNLHSVASELVGVLRRDPV